MSPVVLGSPLFVENLAIEIQMCKLRENPFQPFHIGDEGRSIDKMLVHGRCKLLEENRERSTNVEHAG